MRPQSIVLFERVYIVCIALSLLSGLLFLLHPPIVAFPPNAPAPAAAMAAQMMRVLPVAGTLVGLVISLLFLYFIARKGSDVARWIFVVLFVLGLAGFVRQFASQVPVMIPLGLRALGWFHLALQALCVWLLFRPDAKPWFRD